ncbi:MAG: hypothetical protein CMK59_07680 [Proteobacteria bacterium]|nr:hypothetical protein [Pseudomonadota bacterium]
MKNGDNNGPDGLGVKVSKAIHQGFMAMLKADTGDSNGVERELNIVVYCELKKAFELGCR